MAGQDYKRVIPAGGATRINANGETFLFCKFADRDVTVDIAGKKAVMRAGSYQEFEPLSGPNSAVTIYNEDPERPAAVIFNMGTGTYDEKIIRGEISIEPVLRNEDGTTKPDTRFEIDIGLEPVKISTESFNEADVLAEVDYYLRFETRFGIDFDASNAAGDLFWGPDDTLCFDARTDFDPFQRGYVIQCDPRTLELLRAVPGNISTGGPEAATWMPSQGYLVAIDDTVQRAQGVDPSDRVTVINAPFLVARMDYNKFTDRLCVFSKAGQVAIYDNTLTLLNVIDTGMNNVQNVAFDIVTGNFLVYLTSNGFWWLDGETFQILEGPFNYSAQIYSEGMAIAGKRFYAGDDTVLRLQAWEDFTTKPEFTTVKPNCELLASLLTRNKGSQTTAEIAVTTVGAGLTVQGEVIKAALEYHFGLPVKGNYLDHVYGFYRGKSAVGANQKPIVTGNQTFARANVADDFTVYLPDTLKLIIDNEIEFDSELLF